MLALVALVPTSGRAAAGSATASEAVWRFFAEVRLIKRQDRSATAVGDDPEQSAQSLAARAAALNVSQGRAEVSDQPPAASRPVPGNSPAAEEPPPPMEPELASAPATEAIVYVRVPRTTGDHEVTLKDGSSYVLRSPDVWDTLPDSRRVFGGFNAPGQLVLRAKDGSERILYDCVGREPVCVPLDPAVSLDGRRVLFSVYRGELGHGWWRGTTLPNRRLGSPLEAQLHVVELETGRVTALAHEPGVFDVSPTWLPDGRIMFASTRAGFAEPALKWISPNNRRETQLYIASADGTDAVNVSPHEIATAMHPYLLDSGRIAYSSQWLSHNLAYWKTNGGINWPATLDNNWLIMESDRRGGDMMALLGAHRSAFSAADGRTKTMKALHFLGQRHNGDICASNYYRGNNLGLGDVLCWTPEAPGIEGALPNFLPRRLYNVANWTKSNDEPSWKVDGIYQGKIGYPEGLPNGQLLLSVGRGYCTQVSGTVKSFQRAVSDQPQRRACDVGLYQTTRIPSERPGDLQRWVDLSDWHEFSARVVRRRTVETPRLRDSDDGACVLASSDAGTAETSPHRAYEFNNNYFHSCKQR